jgi:hypothetical protein
MADESLTGVAAGFVTAFATGKTGGRASLDIDGERVPLSPEGIAKAQAEHGNVGEKIAESVRAAVERAEDG